MNHTKINNFLMEMGGEWITWRRNLPMASNMGEAWNRQICSTRNIFNSLLRTHGESPNDESLRKSLVEPEGILNSRPITCDSIGDVNSYLPVSPMQLLSMKTKMVMPPSGIFQKEDLYCRKQQRHVQHLCDEFWSRWRKEVYATQQAQQKLRRDFQVVDIVLVCDDTIRNVWPMAQILKSLSDNEGLVHSVQLVIGKNSSNNKGISVFERPVNKFVLVVENKR